MEWTSSRVGVGRILTIAPSITQLEFDLSQPSLIERVIINEQIHVGRICFKYR